MSSLNIIQQDKSVYVFWNVIW